MTDFQTTVQAKFVGTTAVLQKWFKDTGTRGLQRIERNVTIGVSVVGGAYLLASIASALLMSSMMTSIMSARARLGVRTADDAGAESFRPAPANMRDVAKSIKERNLFNSEGAFPEEKFGTGTKASGSIFDINAPCRPTSLPIELLGTIYLGDRLKSIATVHDKAYSEADVYRVGDEIYGNEGARVAAVERQTLIIDNNGTKECIELDKSANGQANDGFPSFGGGEFGGTPSAGGGGGAEVALESSYVESELGPGFAKIMDAARFVPNTTEGGGINGFKVFSIKSGTIFSRIGLQNNDVITQVNDTSLSRADQGFAFYQAMQDEKEVRLQILRGNSPVNVVVRIK